jgi:hypothetical protein
VVLASQVSTTSKPKWRLSQLENFYCSARRPAGFLQDSSGIFRIRSSFSSQRLSRIFLVTVSPSPSHTTSWRHQPGRARPGRKRAPTAEELRRRHKISLGNQDGLPRATLKVPLNHESIIKYRKRGVTSPARHHTLRGAGTGQNRPVYTGQKINVVLSLKRLYFSPFRAPIWTPDLCFVAGPTFWVFWVVILPIFFFVIFHKSF